MAGNARSTSSSSITERVVRAMAARTGRDPIDLPPLYEAVDPEALDASLDFPGTGHVRFQYAGHVVTLDGDGTVDVASTATAAIQCQDPSVQD